MCLFVCAIHAKLHGCMFECAFVCGRHLQISVLRFVCVVLNCFLCMVCVHAMRYLLAC